MTIAEGERREGRRGQAFFWGGGEGKGGKVGLVFG